jgi:hypothetical protein
VTQQCAALTAVKIRLFLLASLQVPDFQRRARATALSRRQQLAGALNAGWPKSMMKISYSGYRFPPEIIHQAICLCLRFTLRFCDVEDLLAERGIAVSYETVRRWVNHFGPIIAAHLRKPPPEAACDLAS